MWSNDIVLVTGTSLVQIIHVYVEGSELNICGKCHLRGKDSSKVVLVQRTECCLYPFQAQGA